MSLNNYNYSIFELKTNAYFYKMCDLCNNINLVNYSYTKFHQLIDVISFSKQYYCLCFLMANIKGRYNDDSVNALLLYEFKQAINNNGIISILYNNNVYICIHYNYVVNDNTYSNINLINITNYEILNTNFKDKILTDKNDTISVFKKKIFLLNEFFKDNILNKDITIINTENELYRLRYNINNKDNIILNLNDAICEKNNLILYYEQIISFILSLFIIISFILI